MKSQRIFRLMSDMKRDDTRVSGLAIAAMLVITILYSVTIIAM